ncbi:MAG: MFS transporter [Gemmatimonadales bacterium]|nr:MFS transporter [Gemmatimonadales bacterium]
MSEPHERWRVGPLRDPEFKKVSVLIATAMIDMIGFAIIFPLLPFYAIELNASPFAIGWIMASFSVAQLASAPLWGRVSDRHGRRPAVLAGLAASGIAYLVFGYATSLWVLLLSRLVQGAGGGTTAVLHAYVGDAIRPERRAQALGWISAATGLGVSVGPLIGSWAVKYGTAVPGMVAAGLCLLNFVFTWKWLPESRIREAGDAARPRRSIRAAFATVVRRPRETVSRLVWIYGAGMLGFSAMTSVFALYLHDRFAITADKIGPFFTYLGLLNFGMRAIVLGPAVRRLGETGAIRLGTITLVVGLVAYPLVPSLMILPLVMLLMPIGTALLFPSTTALMTKYSDPSALGTTMGVAQAFAGTSRVVAPLAATFLFQRLGAGTPFYVAAAIVAMVGLLAFQLPDRPAGPQSDESG